MPFIEQLGQQAASQAVNMGLGTVFGLMLQKQQDARQLKQQKKLMDLEIGGQQQMMDYSYGKQLQMWKDTNYSEQMKQLAKAGLNPGLLYGMGGGGGQSTGTPAGNVTGAHAPVGGGEIMGIANMAMQNKLLDAQVKNIEADTKNKEATTPKIETETASLAQGIQNAKAAEELTKVETKVKNLEVQFLDKSMNDRLDIVNTEALKLVEEYDILSEQLHLDRATRLQKAELLKTQLVGAGLSNLLTQAQTGATKQSTAESQARVGKIAFDMSAETQKLLQGWIGLSQEDKKIRLEAIQRRLQTEQGWTDGRGVRWYYENEQKIINFIDQIMGKILNNQ